MKHIGTKFGGHSRLNKQGVKDEQEIELKMRDSLHRMYLNGVGKLTVDLNILKYREIDKKT